MQIIFVVESRASAKTDYRYIKSVFDHYFSPRCCQLKVIYAGSKTKLLSQEKAIRSALHGHNGMSYVVFVADVDQKDDPLNEKIAELCKEKGYHLVWMMRDIEEVFLGRRVKPKEKEKASLGFLKTSNSHLAEKIPIEEPSPLDCDRGSNLLCVLRAIIKK